MTEIAPRFRRTMIVALCALCTACGNEEVSRLRLERERVGATQYESELASWLRDSTVIDSISRTVPTDSLFRLERSKLTARNLQLVIQEIACMETRFAWKYGDAPSDLAIRRMRDTLWKGIPASRLADVEARLPTLAEERIGISECGLDGIPMADSIAGTPLGELRPRPTKTRS